MNGNFQHIKLPPRVKAGDDVRAEDHNQLIDVLRAVLAELRHVTPRPSADIGVKTAATGSTFWLKKKPHAGGKTSLQFEPYNLALDGETWKVRVRPGWIINRDTHADADEVLASYMPVAPGVPSSTPLDAETPPSIAVAAGKSVFVKLVTNKNDKIEEDPQIVVLDTPGGSYPNKGQQAIPEEINSQTGEYFYRLFDVESVPDSDPPALRIGTIYHIGAPIYHEPATTNIRNIGGKRELFKQPDDTRRTLELRTLEQLEGDGAEIIKPLDPGDPEADPPVPAEAPTDTIKFRRIRKNNSGSVPYEIEGDGDHVNFRFYGLEGFQEILDGGGITFAAGLATRATSPTERWTGNITFIHNPVGASSVSMTISVVNGRISGVTGGTSNTGLGTAGDPGSVDFITDDTDT